MAYVVDSEKDKENAENASTQLTSGISVGGPQNANISGSGASPSAPTKSGSFVNFQEYTNANQDKAPEVSGVINQKAQNLGNQYQQFGQEINNIKQSNQLDSGSTQRYQDYLNRLNKVNYNYGNTQTDSPEAKNQNIEDTRFAGQLKNVGYTGAKDTTELEQQKFQNLRSNEQDLQDDIGMSKTDEGQRNFLDKTYGQNRSLGVKDLDYSLFRNNQANVEKMNTSAQQANQMLQNQVAQRGQYEQELGQTQQDVANRQAQIQADLQGILSKYDTTTKTGMAEAQKKIDEYNFKLRGSGKFNENTAEGFRLSQAGAFMDSDFARSRDSAVQGYEQKKALVAKAKQGDYEYDKTYVDPKLLMSQKYRADLINFENAKNKVSKENYNADLNALYNAIAQQTGDTGINSVERGQDFFNGRDAFNDQASYNALAGQKAIGDFNSKMAQLPDTRMTKTYGKMKNFLGIPYGSTTTITGNNPYFAPAIDSALQQGYMNKYYAELANKYRPTPFKI